MSQISLDDDAFVERMQAQREGLSKTVGVPQARKRTLAPPLAELASEFKNRKTKGSWWLNETGAYSYQQIADFYRPHFTTVGKTLRKMRGLQ